MEGGKETEVVGGISKEVVGGIVGAEDSWDCHMNTDVGKSQYTLVETNVLVVFCWGVDAYILKSNVCVFSLDMVFACVYSVFIVF